MRNLISWLRSCFCKHEFEYNEEKYTSKIEGYVIKEGLKWQELVRNVVGINLIGNIRVI